MIRPIVRSIARPLIRAVTDIPRISIVPPGAPTGVTATAGNAQATVSWTAPASSGGAAITGYRITASTGQTATVGNVLTGTITGLTNGVAVTFTVAAFNGVYGPESAASASVTPVALGIANGTFTDATGWTLGAGWTISGGKLNGSATTANADIAFSGWTTDTLYRVRMAVDSITAGDLNVELSGASVVGSPRVHTTGTGTIDFLVYTGTTAAGASPVLRLRGSGAGFSGVIDNIVVTADVVIGAEQYADPGFDSPAAWTPGAGWTISGSAANGSATTAACSTATAFAPAANSYYLSDMVVATLTGGTVKHYQNGLAIANDVFVSATGTVKRLAWSGTIPGTGGGVQGGTAFTGTVTSLSLKVLT